MLGSNSVSLNATARFLAALSCLAFLVSAVRADEPAIVEAKEYATHAEMLLKEAKNRAMDADKMVSEVSDDERSQAENKARVEWQKVATLRQQWLDADTVRRQIEAAAKIKSDRVGVANATVERASKLQKEAHKAFEDSQMAVEKEADSHKKAELQRSSDEKFKVFQKREDELLKAKEVLQKAEGLDVRTLSTASGLGPMANNGASVANNPAVGAGLSAIAAAFPNPEVDRVVIILAGHSGPTTVGGTTNEIAQGVRSNLIMMQNLLVSESNGKAVTPVILQDQSFTHQNILAAITSARVTANDTLFLYIACHGATDIASNQHALQVPGATTSASLVARATYLNALKAKGARQTVMVTDTCSNAVRVNLPQVALSANVAAGMPETYALSKLLRYQSGVFDFGGSRPPSAPGDRGEFGAYNDPGGLFTRAFYDAARYADTSQGWMSYVNDINQQIGNVQLSIRVGSTTVSQAGQHCTPFHVR